MTGLKNPKMSAKREEKLEKPWKTVKEVPSVR